MCLWVRALDVYGSMVKVVEPKRQALHRAEAALAEVQAQLTAKRQQLKYGTASCPAVARVTSPCIAAMMHPLALLLVLP